MSSLTVRGSSGYNSITISTIPSMVTCNQPGWLAGQGMFALQGNNQMECVVCSSLEWHLVERGARNKSDSTAQMHFKTPGPYIADRTPLSPSSPLPPPSTTPQSQGSHKGRQLAPTSQQDLPGPTTRRSGTQHWMWCTKGVQAIAWKDFKGLGP